MQTLHQRARGLVAYWEFRPYPSKDLQEEGERMNHKRLARLMRSAGLRWDQSAAKGSTAAIRVAGPRALGTAPSLVQRCYRTAERTLHRLWRGRHHLGFPVPWRAFCSAR